jgi:hypothetical protein
MNEHDKYIVNDLTHLASSIRKNAAMNIGDTENQDLNTFVSIHQVESVILENTDKDEENNIIMDEDQYNTIFNEVSDWIINSGLSKLAAEDKIQCAWDDEQNCMIFWHNETSSKQ